ncbi:prolipoprotein diacylglyceryl transferase [Virgibacillus xinjiangensis]|uniref:Phosphatidylglycerol--prolipoprotein diacylglyceryl transferase n=1 Tax=Virgibacillus xinjiangensis TaxID=393090 RepID=A0ABV7CXU6_9BACI
MLASAQPLDPVFLELGPLTIYWYGVIIATGAFLGIYLASKESDRLGLEKDILIDFIFFAIPIAIISARIYYVIFEWENYAGGPWWGVFAIWEGGIAIHGAIIGGVLTAVVFTRKRNISFWQLADIIAPSLILGQAIGRWGNFMNQEAHGGPVSDAAYNDYLQYLPDFILNQMTIGGTLYHPTFLYESLWNILVFILLILMRKYNPIRGEIFLTYAISYSVGRFFVEGLRTDSLYFGDIRQAQLISILTIVVAAALIIYRRMQGGQVRYEDVTARKKGKNNSKGKKTQKRK